MNRTAIFVVVILLAGVSAGAWLILGKGSSTGTGEESSDEGVDPKIRRQLAEERAFESEYKKLSDSQAKIAQLEKLKDKSWARPNTAVLLKAVTSDPDDDVRRTALDVAAQLFEKAKVKFQLSETIRAGLSSSSSSVQRRAACLASEHPDPDLMPDLIAVIDSNSENRGYAVGALAFIDLPEAKARVLAEASREDQPVEQRAGCVAALAATKDPAAMPLLRSLAAGENDKLAATAKKVMEEMGER